MNLILTGLGGLILDSVWGAFNFDRAGRIDFRPVRGAFNLDRAGRIDFRPGSVLE